MNTYQKQLQAVADIRATMRNPFRAIRLLKALRNGNKPTEQFAGWLQYYLRYGDFDLEPILKTSLFELRSRRCNVVQGYLRRCWLEGFINDNQFHLLQCCVNAINKLIKRYILIYIFL